MLRISLWLNLFKLRFSFFIIQDRETKKDQHPVEKPAEVKPPVPKK